MTETGQTERRKPETLRIRQITPSLTVGDIEVSVGWYTEVLGCTVEERHEHEGRVVAVSLKAGSASIVLGQDDWARGRDRVKGVGFRLYCSTAQDVDQLAADIRARGGTLASGPADQPWGARDFALVDPDGFQITVTSEV